MLIENHKRRITNINIIILNDLSVAQMQCEILFFLFDLVIWNALDKICMKKNLRIMFINV